MIARRPRAKWEIVHADALRSVKAEILRATAADLRHAADAGTDPESNRVAADLLEQRAARILAGADDHSALLVDPSTPSGVTRRAPEEPDARTE